MRKDYYKLVRDHIPEIIRADGYICEVEVMNEEEYRQALRQKLVEEAVEAAEASGTPSVGAPLTNPPLVTELADLREVMDALIRSYGIDLATVQVEQERRRSERGGFEQRLRLIWTSPQKDVKDNN